MYSKQTDFEQKLIDFGTKVEYIVAAEMAGKKDANQAYKEVKSLFEDLKKFRKQERREDNPLDYDDIPPRY
jgi:hypothetical protein